MSINSNGTLVPNVKIFTLPLRTPKTKFVSIDRFWGVTLVTFCKGKRVKSYTPTKASLKRISDLMNRLQWDYSVRATVDELFIVYSSRPNHKEINLTAVIEQAAGQIYGSDERSLLYQFLQRNNGQEQIVMVGGAS